MHPRSALPLGAVLVAGLLTAVAGVTTAQAAEPTYQGDPDVYKVIFEDANFRVIEGVRKAGVRDKSHGHPVPSVIYNVTDCKSRQYGPDGKSTESDRKAGTAFASPVVDSHSVENIATTDCKQIFVEKK